MTLHALKGPSGLRLELFFYVEGLSIEENSTLFISLVLLVKICFICDLTIKMLSKIVAENI